MQGKIRVLFSRLGGRAPRRDTPLDRSGWRGGTCQITNVEEFWDSHSKNPSKKMTDTKLETENNPHFDVDELGFQIKNIRFGMIGHFWRFAIGLIPPIHQLCSDQSYHISFNAAEVAILSVLLSLQLQLQILLIQQTSR